MISEDTIPFFNIDEDSDFLFYYRSHGNFKHIYRLVLMTVNIRITRCLLKAQQIL